MPEYTVDPSLSRYNEPGTGTKILRGARSVWAGLEAIEKKKDEAFVDVVKFITHGDVDLSPIIEAHERTKSLAPVVGGPIEAILVDQVLTSPTSSGADAPFRRQTAGGLIIIEDQAAGEQKPAAPQVKVSMLPMWNADP